MAPLLHVKGRSSHVQIQVQLRTQGVRGVPALQRGIEHEVLERDCNFILCLTRSDGHECSSQGRCPCCSVRLFVRIINQRVFKRLRISFNLKFNYYIALITSKCSSSLGDVVNLDNDCGCISLSGVLDSGLVEVGHCVVNLDDGCSLDWVTAQSEAEVVWCP